MYPNEMVILISELSSDSCEWRQLTVLLFSSLATCLHSFVCEGVAKLHETIIFYVYCVISTQIAQIFGNKGVQYSSPPAQ